MLGLLDGFGFLLLDFSLLGTFSAQAVSDARCAELTITILAYLQARFTHCVAAGLAFDQTGVARGLSALIATAAAAVTVTEVPLTRRTDGHAAGAVMITAFVAGRDARFAVIVLTPLTKEAIPIGNGIPAIVARRAVPLVDANVRAVGVVGLQHAADECEKVAQSAPEEGGTKRQ
jgi:hypothetical protein